MMNSLGNKELNLKNSVKLKLDVYSYPMQHSGVYLTATKSPGLDSSMCLAGLNLSKIGTAQPLFFVH